jgi:hypothetical protein
MSDTKNYDSLQGFVLFVGVFEGLLPFIGRFAGFSPILSLPLRLDSPAWWLVSGTVIVISLALLIVLERAKEQAA